MTENKRFLIDDAGELIDLENHKFIDYGYECCKLLNELNDENKKLKIFLKAVNEELDLANRDCDILEEEYEQLKSDNQELKQDNDIKFWKHECIKEANANSVLLFELGKAIDGGYEVSDKFKDFMNDLNKSIENEKKKLKRSGLND